MITKQEIAQLNKTVDIGVLFTFLGCPSKLLRPMNKNRSDWRFPAFFRGGDNPNGCAATYNYDDEKFRVTDFTHKTFSNIDLIEFITKHCGHSFQDAIGWMSFASGKEMDKQINNGQIEGVNYFEQELTEPVPIDPAIGNAIQFGLHPYWANRGYTPEVAKQFMLGYYPFNGSLKDRVVHPVFDEQNRLVAIQGRSIDDNINPKYMFGSTQQGQSANLTLYNYFTASMYAREKRWIGVVESANSVWRAYQYGHHNFVASLGTSVTDRQINLLASLGIDVVLFIDHDDDESMAGQVAAMKTAARLKEKGCNVWITIPPFVADPADLNMETFNLCLKNPKWYQ